MGFGNGTVCQKNPCVVGMWVEFLNLLYLAILILFWCQKLVMKPHQKLKINPTKYYKDVITLWKKIL